MPHYRPLVPDAGHLCSVAQTNQRDSHLGMGEKECPRHAPKMKRKYKSMRARREAREITERRASSTSIMSAYKVGIMIEEDNS